MGSLFFSFFFFLNPPPHGGPLAAPRARCEPHGSPRRFPSEDATCIATLVAVQPIAALDWTYFRLQESDYRARGWLRLGHRGVGQRDAMQCDEVEGR